MDEFFDTHFHLYEEDNLAQLLISARQAGVGWLTAVAVDLASSRQLPGLVAGQGDPRLLCTVGLHPHEALQHHDVDLGEFRQLALLPQVAAIGEIGLDYHYNFSPPSWQRDLFRRMLEIAVSLSMPVVVHCREAYEDCFQILQELAVASHCRVLLHSYTGSAEWALRFSQECDAWFSFNGIVTFKKSGNVRSSLAVVPDDRLLLESDAPYLAPVPCRGQRNQPALLPHIAAFVAGQRGCEVGDLAVLTTANARCFFGV